MIFLHHLVRFIITVVVLSIILSPVDPLDRSAPSNGFTRCCGYAGFRDTRFSSPPPVCVARLIELLLLLPCQLEDYLQRRETARHFCEIRKRGFDYFEDKYSNGGQI